MIQAVFDWLRTHPALVTSVGVASLVFFVGSLLALPLLVGMIPVDYFARPEAPPSRLAQQHPTIRLVLRALKNLLGVVLLLMGIAMLVLPGQGLLTILVGLIMIDGPGKRRLELWVVRRGAIRRSLDWLRARRGRPPLEVCEAEAS